MTKIESVLKQTDTDFELLIWDDGSTDKSVEIASGYAEQDKRVRVVAAPHTGRGQAHRDAIACASTADTTKSAGREEISTGTASNPR